jgi:hypothetical protein
MGDPTNLESREWLGCIAWDGHPQNFTDLQELCSEQDFRDAVGEISKRKDFATPTRGWPFPWADDMFLTDYTYAFFDGAVRVCHFHQEFTALSDYLTRRHDEENEPPDDPRHRKVPAPAAYDTSQPDSIMILRM